MICNLGPLLAFPHTDLSVVPMASQATKTTKEGKVRRTHSELHSHTIISINRMMRQNSCTFSFTCKVALRVAWLPTTATTFRMLVALHGRYWRSIATPRVETTSCDLHRTRITKLTRGGVRMHAYTDVVELKCPFYTQTWSPQPSYNPDCNNSSAFRAREIPPYLLQFAQRHNSATTSKR